MADSSVIITVGMDIDDAEKDLDRLGKRVIKLQNDLNETKGKKTSLEQEFERANEELKKLYATAARDKNGLLPPDEAAKLEQLEQHAAWLGEQIEKTRDQEIIDKSALDGAKTAYGEFAAEVERVRALEQEQKNAEAQRLAEIAANAEVADQKIVDLVAELDALKARQTELQSAGVGLGFQEFDDNARRIAEINAELNEYRANIRSADAEEERLGKNTSGASEGMRRAAGFADRFASRLKSIVAGAFVFNILSAGLRQLQQWLFNLLQTNAEAQASLSQLKAAFLTLAQPILQVLIPALVFLLNVLTRVVTMIASIFSKLFGTTLASSAKSAQALYKANTGVGSTAGGASKSLNKEAGALKEVKKEAKEATKSLAAFDEINTLETDKPDEDIDDMADALNDLGGDGGGLGGIGGGGGMPDFASIIKAQIDAILELFVGIALLALGAILTFTGANIPLGIGLMILGAMMIADAVMTDWNAIQKALQGPLGALLALIGASLLVIGAVLAFSSPAHLALGIALMAIGAAALATAVAVNWDTIVQALQGPLGELTALLGAALLVIGGILAFSGVNLPLGIGLMAVGAVGLAATAAANWETVVTAMQGPIGQIIVILSGALLAIGAILLLSGAAIPLGLGLMVAGAAGLAAEVAANWDEVVVLMDGKIGVITGFLSMALLAIGFILLLSAVNIPLGLGLIAAGAVGLAAALAPNWEEIQTILQGKIGAITAMVSAALLVLGVILVFTGVGIPLGLGMILAGAIGLAATVAANWDFILEKLKGAWERITNWWNSNVKNFVDPSWWSNLGEKMVNGLMQGLNSIFSKIGEWINGIKSRIQEGLSNIASGFGGGGADASGVGRRSIAYDALPSIPVAQVPAFARGAVIPANHEFLAVLGDQPTGTNVEAPLATIEQALENVYSRHQAEKEDIKINFVGDLAQLARVLKPVIEREQRRVGGTLITESISTY